MAFNRSQFQPGMSIPDFLRSFGTEAQCVEAVKAARWPGGFQCPRCSSAEHYVVGHGARKLFRCNGCRHQTSLTAGSLMEHTKHPGERLVACRNVQLAKLRAHSLACTCWSLSSSKDFPPCL